MFLQPAHTRLDVYSFSQSLALNDEQPAPPGELIIKNFKIISGMISREPAHH